MNQESGLIKIIKSTGERAPFDIEKVKNTCRRAGAGAPFCEHVAKQIEARVKDGTTTREIYNLVFETLKNESPAMAARYSLRDAILKLGPLGFDFEKYIARLLAAYGYQTELPPILQGACITHEVDVLATKDNRTAMMECKFRHDIGIFIGIKDTMATWARFLDLVDGAAANKAPHIDECWLVTNSRFSHDAIQYGHCKNMVMLSWTHPKERPLPAWIDDLGLYPITVLPSLSQEIAGQLIQSGFILVQDLAQADVETVQAETSISNKKLVAGLIDLAKQVLPKS